MPHSLTEHPLRYFVIAVVYGIGMYLLAGSDALDRYAGVLTLGFLVGAPVAIRFLAVRGIRSEHPLVAAFAPWVPLALILAFLLATGLEGLICVVMALPLLLGGALAGGLLAHLRDDHRVGA